MDACMSVIINVRRINMKIVTLLHLALSRLCTSASKRQENWCKIIKKIFKTFSRRDCKLHYITTSLYFYICRAK